MAVLFSIVMICFEVTHFQHELRGSTRDGKEMFLNLFLIGIIADTIRMLNLMHAHIVNQGDRWKWIQHKFMHNNGYHGIHGSHAGSPSSLLSSSPSSSSSISSPLPPAASILSPTTPLLGVRDDHDNGTINSYLNDGHSHNDSSSMYASVAVPSSS
jgi:hypothetical protein